MIATNERQILNQSSSNLCKQWQGFIEDKWTKEINVRNFIQKITPLMSGMNPF